MNVAQHAMREQRGNAPGQYLVYALIELQGPEQLRGDGGAGVDVAARMRSRPNAARSVPQYFPQKGSSMENTMGSSASRSSARRADDSIEMTMVAHNAAQVSKHRSFGLSGEAASSSVPTSAVTSST
jgi:hypothetical protein